MRANRYNIRMKLFMVAGEASGDLHAGNLAAAILKKIHDVKIIGFGGEHMRRSGVDIRFDLTSLAVVGFVEVLEKLGRIKKAMKDAKEAILSERPDAIVLVDYPGFNMRLARYAHNLGIPVIYYIAPQVWAWHRSRVKKIARTVDKLIVVFEFEVEFFKRYGIEASFVGHPLLDTLSTGDRAENTGPGQLVGILPGSRRMEVEKLLPIMLDAAKILKSEMNDITFQVSCADTVSEKCVRRIVEVSAVPVEIIRGAGHAITARANAVMVASGTATLESCILTVPMVVLYKVSFLSYLVGRMMVKVPHMSLVNLIADEAVVPEFAQNDATAEKVAECVKQLLAESDEMKEKLREVKNRLGVPGASDRVAEEVIKYMSWKSS